MASKCPPCKKGAPGWMVTFGDMMALLLTFFVLLLSFAQLDIVKFEEASGSMKDAFGIQRIQQINPLPTGETMVSVEFQQEIILIRIKERLEMILENTIDNGEAEILEVDEGFVVRLNNDILFDRDTMAMKADSKPMLQQIANLLADKPNLVHVVGHTDNQPAHVKGPFTSNWAVSAARAATMVEFFASEGNVDTSRLQVRGMGSVQPRDNNDTESGRARNRRIEVLISRETSPVVVDSFLKGTEFVDGGEPVIETPRGP